MNIPIVTKEQAQKVDDLAVNHYGIEIIQMMENASRNTAFLAKQILGDVKGKKILILAGKGNNGGDGIVAGRFLHNWGADISIILAEIHGKLTELTKKQLRILKAMDVDIIYPSDIKYEELKGDLIIDGILGYNINRNPAETYAKLIEFANDSGTHILSIDVPSGLDPETGKPYTPCIKAKTTLCLANVKKGCIEGREYSGDIYVADIGLPPELYKMIDLQAERMEGIIKFT